MQPVFEMFGLCDFLADEHEHKNELLGEMYFIYLFIYFSEAKLFLWSEI